MCSWDSVKMNFSERPVCISAARFSGEGVFHVRPRNFLTLWQGCSFGFYWLYEGDINTNTLNKLSPTTQGQNGPRHWKLKLEKHLWQLSPTVNCFSTLSCCQDYKKVFRTQAVSDNSWSWFWFFDLYWPVSQTPVDYERKRVESSGEEAQDKKPRILIQLRPLGKYHFLALQVL